MIKKLLTRRTNGAKEVSTKELYQLAVDLIRKHNNLDISDYSDSELSALIYNLRAAQFSKAGVKYV